MTFSKEEKDRIRFIVNEVLREVNRGALIEIDKTAVYIKVWDDEEYHMIEPLYTPIHESEVFKILTKMKEVLDEIEEEKKRKELRRELSTQAAEKEDEDD